MLGVSELLTRLGYPDDSGSIETRLKRFQDEAGLGSLPVNRPEITNLLSRLADWDGVEGLPWPGALESGSKGVYVRSIQYRLQTFGFYTKKIDGDFGPFTCEAILNCKRVLGYPQAGSPTVEEKFYRLLSDPYALNAAVLNLNSGQPITIRHWIEPDMTKEAATEGKSLYLRNGRFERSNNHTRHDHGLRQHPAYRCFIGKRSEYDSRPFVAIVASDHRTLQWTNRRSVLQKIHRRC